MYNQSSLSVEMNWHFHRQKIKTSSKRRGKEIGTILVTSLVVLQQECAYTYKIFLITLYSCGGVVNTQIKDQYIYIYIYI